MLERIRRGQRNSHADDAGEDWPLNAMKIQRIWREWRLQVILTCRPARVGFSTVDSIWADAQHIDGRRIFSLMPP